MVLPALEDVLLPAAALAASATCEVSTTNPPSHTFLCQHNKRASSVIAPPPIAKRLRSSAAASSYFIFVEEFHVAAWSAGVGFIHGHCSLPCRVP